MINCLSRYMLITIMLVSSKSSLCFSNEAGNLCERSFFSPVIRKGNTYAPIEILIYDPEHNSWPEYKLPAYKDDHEIYQKIEIPFMSIVDASYSEAKTFV